jgi:hypothetical protein
MRFHGPLFKTETSAVAEQRARLVETTSDQRARFAASRRDRRELDTVQTASSQSSIDSASAAVVMSD